MQNAAEISSLASQSMSVDSIARAIVGGLTKVHKKGLAVRTEFSVTEDDDCSFQVQCHRINLRFAFRHIIIKESHLEALAGRYDMLKLDREGRWLLCNAGFSVYQPGNLVFDGGTSLQLPVNPDAGDWQEVQNMIAFFAYGTAQRNLETKVV